MKTNDARSLQGPYERLLLLLLILTVSCAGMDGDTGPRRIVYWEKWNGFEGEAADRMVAAFNEKERHKAEITSGYRPIEVQKVSVTRIEQKLLVAIAGGNPPDVAGAYTRILYPYVDKGALMDLTPMLKEAGITRDRYVPVYWDICEYRGRMWALPTTPATTALHWNKRLFSEAGLDPETPPRTIEELNAFSEKLTKWEVTLPNGRTEIRNGYLPGISDENKRLIQVGFLSSEPGWWSYGWGFYFGGTLLDGQGDVTALSPENMRAYDWIASFTRNMGVQNRQRFVSGFGNFSSPQNAFMSGKVAMEVQGVWMYNFIDKYAPGMQWSAAPFPHPASLPELQHGTFVDADVIVIPKDSKHPEEAFEFIRFVNSQEGMEILCLGQKKFSPLIEVSEHFLSVHPHPYIEIFRKLAFSPNGFTTPKTGVWNEYLREMDNSNTRIRNLNATPEEGLRIVQERISGAVERNRRMIARRISQE